MFRLLEYRFKIGLNLAVGCIFIVIMYFVYSQVSEMLMNDYIGKVESLLQQKNENVLIEFERNANDAYIFYSVSGIKEVISETEDTYNPYVVRTLNEIKKYDAKIKELAIISRTGKSYATDYQLLELTDMVLNMTQDGWRIENVNSEPALLYVFDCDIRNSEESEKLVILVNKEEMFKKLKVSEKFFDVFDMFLYDTEKTLCISGRFQNVGYEIRMLKNNTHLIDKKEKVFWLKKDVSDKIAVIYGVSLKRCYNELYILLGFMLSIFVITMCLMVIIVNYYTKSMTNMLLGLHKKMVSYSDKIDLN